MTIFEGRRNRRNVLRAVTAVAALAITAPALSACGGSDSSSEAPSSSKKWVSAISADKGGGMDALEKDAKAEGTLNVIALPHNWSNYGQVIEGFKKKYPGIKVNELNPNASSAEEISAAKTNAGTNKAPDVFDLGIGVATTNTDKFAPYKVASFNDIPAGAKDSNGAFVGDYTGLMTLGYNKTKYGSIDVNNLKRSLSDPKFKGTVALNGKPAEAGSAQNGFLAVNLNQGGSLDNFQPGLDFFKALKDAGNLNTIDVTDATIDSGQTGVVFDWSYNQEAIKERLSKQQNVDWEVLTLPNGEVEQYYNQAVNKDAPHPAAARLWEEYLYSPDAQNEWMRGGAIPSLLEKMKKDGTVDKDALAKLPEIKKPVTYTSKQADAMTTWLGKNWPKTIGN